MSDKKVVEFKGMVVANPCNMENYKVYGLYVDCFQYPDIQVNKYNNVSIIGNLPTLDDGVEYTVKAEEQNGKHGIAYKVINIKRDRPRTEEATRLFLQEILVSQEQVEEIMREYPDIIDRVINDRTEDIDIKKLYNIGEYRLGVIKRRIIENFALAELVDDFKGYIEFKVLKVLYDKYGSVDKIKEELKHDPYKCLCGLSRIGFKTADKILLEFSQECNKLKTEGQNPPIEYSVDLLTSPQRQKAAIMFLLEENENSGNTKINIKALRKQSEALANKSIEHFVDIIKSDADIYFDKETKTVALASTYETEKYIAKKIQDGLLVQNKWDVQTEKYKTNSDITLTDQQYKILPMLCESNVCILNGFGGSGKSATTKSVIDMLKDNSKSFILLAPTGRAAKVLAEYTKENASTIHRGLGFHPAMGWGYDEQNPLPYDIVIVDEFSMVDIFLAKTLLAAIDFSKTKLLMIGDSAQIPSVSAGNVFFDLINSSRIPLVSLTQIFRYGEGGILTVATKTRNCESFLTNSTQPQIFGEDKGYMFIPTPQEKVIGNVVGLYKKLLSTGYAREDIMILSSYNVGEYGTVNINKHLQPISNPNVATNGQHVQIGDTKFYVNDLVIQTVNNYKAEKHREGWVDAGFKDTHGNEDRVFVANGEIGTILSIEYGKIVIQFDDVVVYEKAELAQVKLAYSISTHKSQGGQAKVIILITPKAHTFMLNSNLIYVGQTRGKQKVFHFGEIETVNRAIKKKADFNRDTYLKELLTK